jgi:hypothetical protein
MEQATIRTYSSFTPNYLFNERLPYVEDSDERVVTLWCEVLKNSIATTTRIKEVLGELKTAFPSARITQHHKYTQWTIHNTEQQHIFVIQIQMDVTKQSDIEEYETIDIKDSPIGRLFIDTVRKLIN